MSEVYNTSFCPICREKTTHEDGFCMECGLYKNGSPPPEMAWKCPLCQDFGYDELVPGRCPSCGYDELELDENP